MGRRARQLRMKLRDDLEVVGQRAQLRRAAEPHLHAGVEIEGLIERIGLHTQQVCLWRGLVELDRVSDVGRVSLRQEVFARERVARHECRIAQVRQQAPDGALQRHVDRAVDLDIQAIEVVQPRHVQEVEQLRARGSDPLRPLAGPGHRAGGDVRNRSGARPTRSANSGLSTPAAPSSRV